MLRGWGFGSVVAFVVATYFLLRRKTDDLDAVLEFWFGGCPDELQRKRWFARGADRDAVDAVVRSRFNRLLSRLTSSKARAWATSPRHAIAVIVALDQLARHAWRDEPDCDRRTAAATAVAVDVCVVDDAPLTAA